LAGNWITNWQERLPSFAWLFFFVSARVRREEDEENSRVRNFVLSTMTGRAPKTQTSKEAKMVMGLNKDL